MSEVIKIKKGLTIYSASQVAAIRILSASLFMVPFAFSWLKRIDKKHLPLIFVSGFIGSFIPAFLFSIAQTQLDSAITGIVNSLTPVFVLVIGVIFYKQKLFFLGSANQMRLWWPNRISLVGCQRCDTRLRCISLAD